MLKHRMVVGFAVVALAVLTIGVARAEGACNPAIQKRIAGKKISFDAVAVDKAKLGVEDAVFAGMKKRGSRRARTAMSGRSAAGPRRTSRP